ncbi:MAG: MgtC/SapB family protein [Gammaproteobacteria bacterium]
MIWLFGDWHYLLGAPWVYSALIVCSIFCGMLIGAEREKNIKPAALRTMILIALGSTLFTMVSFLLAVMATVDGSRRKSFRVSVFGHRRHFA